MSQSIGKLVGFQASNVDLENQTRNGSGDTFTQCLDSNVVVVLSSCI